MKVTVVIPAYNEEQYIGRCLASLTDQTRRADEIVVVDNNSTDRTAAIAHHYGATILKEPRQGIWAAARTGYGAASGDIIARCDADSILPQDWLARIEQTFATQDVIAVTGPGRFYGAPKWLCAIANKLYMDAYFITVGSALKHPPLFGSNFALAKTAWLATESSTHHLREDIHDDIDLSYHLPAGSHVYFDRKLEVLISARPLFNIRGMALRYIKGLRSIYIHWPEKSPWKLATSRNSVRKR